MRGLWEKLGEGRGWETRELVMLAIRWRGESTEKTGGNSGWCGCRRPSMLGSSLAWSREKGVGDFSSFSWFSFSSLKFSLKD